MTGHRPSGAVARNPAPTLGTQRRILMLSWSAYGLIGGLTLLIGAELFITTGPAGRIALDTLWWSLGAFLATVLLIDRSIHAPTAEGGLWVILSSSVCFAGLLLLLAAAHSAYSRAAVSAAYAASVIWLLVGVQRHMRRQILRLGVLESEVMHMLEASRETLAGVRLTHVEADLTESRSLPELRRMDGVVIDRYRAKDASLQRLITQLKLLGVRIYSADHIHELITGRVALDHTEDSFLDDSSGRVMYELCKRVVDVVAAIVLIGLLAIPMLAIAAIVRLVDGESPLFRQERVGRGGRTFHMIKFRTMRGAPGIDAREHVEDRARFEADADTRTTTLGARLRRYRLDELPQLFNVLSGSMSLIGPRPEWVDTAAEFFERIPHYPYRHLVRPGITGWAQISQGHVTALPDAMIKLELDLYYVKHMSFSLDLVVAIRTVRTILTGHGAR